MSVFTKLLIIMIFLYLKIHLENPYILILNNLGTSNRCLYGNRTGPDLTHRSGGSFPLTPKVQQQKVLDQGDTVLIAQEVATDG